MEAREICTNYDPNPCGGICKIFWDLRNCHMECKQMRLTSAYQAKMKILKEGGEESGEQDSGGDDELCPGTQGNEWDDRPTITTRVNPF